MWPAHMPMNSDIDLLVITESEISSQTQEALLNETYPLYLECGRQISPQFWSARKFDQPSTEKEEALRQRVLGDGKILLSRVQLPPSPIPTLRTIELAPDDEPLLQRFFEENPEYFVAAYGGPPGPHEAHEAIHDELPAGWSFSKKWLVGYVDEASSLVAMANVVTDLLAKDVWHIGLFIVATARHGTGDAQALHEGIERWARDNGAKWLRLGVVRGNTRAERYWESLGYIQTRTREGMQMGKLTNTVRVMVKPLTGGTIEEFLSLVPRDRPEGPSAI